MNKFPAIFDVTTSDPSIQWFCQAVKDALEMISGQRAGGYMDYGTINGVETPSVYIPTLASLCSNVTLEGMVLGSSIVSNSITHLQIANTTITADQIALATITGDQIASSTITANEIADATITATQIANATILSANIANATITGANIDAATITSNNIALATILGGNIALATLTGGNIALATIAGNNIDAATITGSNIANQTITATNIGNSEITNNQIASQTIIATNIGDGVITATQIAADAGITGGQIANTTITGDNIANNTIQTGNIGIGAITGTLIANSTILSGNIANNTIIGGNIDSATITGSNIAGTTITGGNIVNDTITATQIANATITSDQIALATITADQIENLSITANKILMGRFVTSTDRDMNQLFHFDNSLESTAGLEPEAGYVATLRDDGWQGGAVAVEEGTTNLVTTNLGFEDGDETGWTLYTTDSGSYNIGAAYAYSGGYGCQMLNSTGGGFTFVYQNITGLAASGTFSFSSRAKWVSGTFTDAPIEARVYYTDASTDSFYSDALSTLGKWERLSVSFTTDSLKTIDHIRISPNRCTVLNGEIWVDDCQLEQKAFPTSFVDGTRATGRLEYAYTLTKQGTFSCRIKLNQDAADLTSFNYIFDTHIPRIIISMTSSLLRLYIIGAHICTIDISSWLATEWHTIGATWDFDNNLWVLQADDAFDSDTTAKAWDTPGGKMYFGAAYSNVDPFNGLIDEARIDSVARTQDELLAWHESGAPFSDPNAMGNVTGTVIIDHNGIQVYDGQITVKDSSGNTTMSGGQIVLTSGAGVSGLLPVANSDAKCTDPNADQTSANTQGSSWLTDQADIVFGNDSITRLVDRTLDNIIDGTNFGRVALTDITNEHVNLISCNGNLDNIENGTTSGKVNLTAISAGKIVLTSLGVSGSLSTSLSDAKCTDPNADQTSVNETFSTDSDINCLNTTNGPAAANADVTSDNETFSTDSDINCLNTTNGPAAANADVTKTIIDAGLITTGYIRSNNWATAAGTQINLNDETLKFGGSQVNAAGDYAGVFLGKDSAKYKFFAGDPESYLSFDGLNTTAKFRSFKFGQEDKPATACTAVLAGDGAGNVDNGTHYYKVTFITTEGETEGNKASAGVTVTDKTSDGKINLTNIPTGSNKVIARKIYRRWLWVYQLLATISDNTTTTYLDNTANADLGVHTGLAYNTTGGSIYLGSSIISHMSEHRTFLGIGAGNIANVTGNNIVCMGYEAGKKITLGNNIVCVGLYAGRTITEGSAITCVGIDADVQNPASVNCAAYGYNTTVTASNKVRIGDANITEIGGQVGWSTLSDRRCKENINPEPLGLEFIKKLEPVNFNFKPTVKRVDKQMELGDERQVIEMEEHPTKRLGLIAQDVKQAADDMGATFDGYYQAQNDDDHDSLVYSSFVIPLINAVKELSMEIEALKSTKNML